MGDEFKSELQRAKEVLANAGVQVPDGKLPETIEEVLGTVVRLKRKIGLARQVLDL